jgi:hypothetical protein
MQGAEDGGRKARDEIARRKWLSNAVRISGLLEGNKDPLLRVAGIDELGHVGISWYCRLHKLHALEEAARRILKISNLCRSAPTCSWPSASHGNDARSSATTTMPENLKRKADNHGKAKKKKFRSVIYIHVS